MIQSTRMEDVYRTQVDAGRSVKGTRFGSSKELTL